MKNDTFKMYFKEFTIQGNVTIEFSDDMYDEKSGINMTYLENEAFLITPIL